MTPRDFGEDLWIFRWFPLIVKVQPKEEAKEERDVRRTIKMLKEVWMQVGLEKVDSHKGVSVKALLDSGATRMFANRKFVEKNNFKLEKLDRSVRIKNMDRTGNSGGLVTHEIEVNVYYQGHVERMRLDVCDLGRTEVILGMPWLAAHNPEINWKTGEVIIMRCPPLCGKNKEKKEKWELEKRRKEKIKEEAAIRWTADKKEDWGKEGEMEMGHCKIEGIVPRRFHRWMKVFGKVESERMPVRKVWDHAIDLREEFVPSKAKVYPLSRNEREEVQNFVNKHLRKGYI